MGTRVYIGIYPSLYKGLYTEATHRPTTTFEASHQKGWKLKIGHLCFEGKFKFDHPLFEMTPNMIGTVGKLVKSSLATFLLSVP